MAIEKPIENPANGVVSSYWKIAYFYADFGTPGVRVVMNGYVDEDARWGGKSPADNRQIDLAPAALVTQFLGGGITLASLYAEIKGQTAIFDGGTDILENPPAS